MEQIGDMLLEAQQRVQLLTQALPPRVDPASISLSAKIPYKVVCYREGLIWRMEELSRSACDSYAREDAVAAIVLTRSATETSAAVWYLHELIKRQIKTGLESDLDEKVMRLLLGHKNSDDLPVAINVLTFLGSVEKVIPNVKRMYDAMSEYAHPNWSGTAGAYSENDTQQILTNYGRGLRNGSDRHARMGLGCLIGSLLLFEHSYNGISEVMPAFIRLCEADLSQGAGDAQAEP